MVLDYGAFELVTLDYPLIVSRMRGKMAIGAWARLLKPVESGSEEQ